MKKDDGNTSAACDDNVDVVDRGEDVKGTVNGMTGSVACDEDRRGVYYKTFYNSNCCYFTICYGVCYCHLLPPLSSICMLGELARVEPLMGLYSYGDTLSLDNKTRMELTDSGQHSSLLRNDNNYRCKKF